MKCDFLLSVFSVIKRVMVLRIYLDTCCYNRPYDNTLQMTVRLEAECKLRIQELAKERKIDLVSSYMLYYECSKIPDDARRENIEDYIKRYAVIHVGDDRRALIEGMADGIMQTGVKFKDACHVASAIYARCDYFISTDKRLLKYRSPLIEVLSPIDFFLNMEGR